MYALFIILNDTYLLGDVHNMLRNCGVGATTMESSGLGHVLLTQDTTRSSFASLRKLMEGDKPNNKTIVSVINTEEKLSEVTDKMLRLLDGLKRPGVGFMFSMPVMKVYGYKGEETANESI